MSEAEKILARMLTIKDLVDEQILTKQIPVVYMPEEDVVYVMNWNRTPF